MDRSNGDFLLNYEFVQCTNPKAETVMFVHGLGLDMHIWDDVFSLFQKEFHVLRFDLPGHGKSLSPKDCSISFEMLMESVKSLLSSLSIKSIHYIGHSGGGNLGIEIARREPDLLKSLTLAATPIFLPKEFGKKELENRIEQTKILTQYHQMTDMLVHSLRYFSDNERIARLKSIYAQVAPEVYRDYFRLIAESILKYSMDEIKTIGIPIMMIQGEYDVIFPMELQVMNINYLKNIRFYILPDSGNLIMMDQPELFIQFTNHFLHKVQMAAKSSEENFTYTTALKNELDSIVKSGMKKADSHNRLEVHTMKSFSVWLNGKELHGKWNQRKAKELLTYLAYHSSVSREQLYDQFWPEADLEKARNLLRVSLSHIKSIFEEHSNEEIDKYIQIDREQISMKVQCHLDFLDLYESVKEIERVEDTNAKSRLAIRILTQLPEVLFPLFYDDWILKIRTDLENIIIEVCEMILEGNPPIDISIQLLEILIKVNPGEDHYYIQLENLQRKNKLVYNTL